MAIARWAVIVVIFGAVSTSVYAAGDVELAKQYFKLGEKLYQRADYAQALKYFRLSHDNAQRPELLYNIARCYELLAQPEKAVEYYERYLKETNRDNKIVKMRIENLKKRIQQPATTPPPKVPPTESTPPAAAAPKGKEQLKIGDEAREPPVDPIEGKGDEDAGGKRNLLMRVLGWSMLGTGGVLIITGAILGGLAAGKASEVEDAAAKGEYWDASASTYSDGESLEKAQVGLLIAGGVVAAAGAVMTILDLTSKSEREPPDASARIVPMVGPGVVGLGSSWRF